MLIKYSCHLKKGDRIIDTDWKYISYRSMRFIHEAIDEVIRVYGKSLIHLQVIYMPIDEK